MGIGLEVLDADGNTIINTSTQTTSILGAIDTSGPGTYSVTDARFELGTPFYMADEFYIGVVVVAVLSGNTYTFTVKETEGGTYKPFKIIYGVY